MLGSLLTALTAAAEPSRSAGRTTSERIRRFETEQLTLHVLAATIVFPIVLPVLIAALVSTKRAGIVRLSAIWLPAATRCRTTGVRSLASNLAIYAHFVPDVRCRRRRETGRVALAALVIVKLRFVVKNAVFQDVAEYSLKAMQEDVRCIA